MRETYQTLHLQWALPPYHTEERERAEEEAPISVSGLCTWERSYVIYCYITLTSMPSPSRSFSTWAQRSFILTLDCSWDRGHTCYFIWNKPQTSFIASCVGPSWLLTSFANVLISASTQSGQSRSPQKRNLYNRQDITWVWFAEG